MGFSRVTAVTLVAVVVHLSVTNSLAVAMSEVPSSNPIRGNQLASHVNAMHSVPQRCCGVQYTVSV